MVAGDVVSGIGAVAAILNFQPAAGVECVLTVAQCQGVWTTLTNGVLSSDVYYFLNNLYNYEKICVNNTNYVSILAGAGSGCFSGMQTK